MTKRKTKATVIEAVKYMANDGIIRIETLSGKLRYFRIKNGRLQMMDLDYYEVPNKDKWINCPPHLNFNINNADRMNYILVDKKALIYKY